MKRLLYGAGVLAFGTSLLLAAPSWGQVCASIQDGTIQASTGETLEPGYDIFGYNYQARIFNGDFCDNDRVLGGDYCDVDLIMKWNDAWLSNKDCDEDNLLDRHFGNETYQGSEAWLTNHQSGRVEANGKSRKWTYFLKIVAAPEDGVKNGAFWETAEGVEIGPVIWGDFAIIEEILNDPSSGDHGVLFLSPSGPGFGHFQ